MWYRVYDKRIPQSESPGKLEEGKIDDLLGCLGPQQHCPHGQWQEQVLHKPCSRSYSQPGQVGGFPSLWPHSQYVPGHLYLDCFNAKVLAFTYLQSGDLLAAGE